MIKKKSVEPTLRGYYAGYATRLMAIIIDVLVLAVVLAISAVLWFILVESVNSVWSLIFGSSGQITGLRVALVVIVPYVTLAIYYVFLWTAIGTSVGGIIVGTKVVNQNGGHPNLFQSIVRFIFEFLIPFFGLFGSLWILFNRDRRALFDRIANTYVIYDWDAKPDELFLTGATRELYGDSIMELLSEKYEEKSK